MPEANVIDEKTEEQKEARFHELNKKQGRSPEEDQELGKLKDDYRVSAKQRIDQITAEKHRERIAREEAEKKAQELEERLAKLEEEKKATVNQPTNNLISRNTIKVGNTSFYTDDTLVEMINNNEITQTQAWQHQQQRIKAEAAEEAYTRIKSEEKANEFKTVREKDFEKVLKKYPQLNIKDPKYNPDDMFTKTVARLWINGYSVNSDGLSRAVEDAEEYIKVIKGVNVDLSSDFSTTGSDRVGEREKTKKEEVTLTEGEKEAALRMYRDVKNQTTGRVYSEAEALEKAKRAKQARAR